ncbi:MAG: DUF2125 domain-containing protein, partial [Rhodobacterales bacterium]
MNRTTQLLGSSAFAALLMAAPACADVTPQQVWDDLAAYLGSTGFDVSADETTQDETLTVSDVLLSMDLPEGEGNIRFAADQIVLSDLGDGSVSVTFPAKMPITMALTPAESEPVDMVVDTTQTGLEMIVSGTPEDMVYEYSADVMGFVLSELVVDGAPVGRDEARFDIAMNTVEGKSSVALGEMREIAQELSVAEVTYDLAFNTPDAASSGVFSGRMDDLTSEGTTSLPLDLNSEDPAAM